MLLGSFICLVVIIISATYEYLGENPTMILLAKIFFYFTLVLFFIFLILYLFNNAPPIPDVDSKRPI